MSRFVRPSLALELRGLVRRGRRGLMVSLSIALGVHLGLMQVHGVEVEPTATKPLTTQFVKRGPRLTKPLELKKHPRPRRRPLRRRVVQLEARADRRAAVGRQGTARVVQSLAKPSLAAGRTALPPSEVAEPSSLAKAVVTTREPKDAIVSSLELLGVEALDTGRHHAMVIQDPRDKRNVRGFFHVARAYPQTVGKIEATNHNNRGSPWALPEAIPRLIEALNQWTRIKADVCGAFTFDSRELFKTPMVFVSSHVPYRLTRAEATTLGRYLLAGGFLYTDTLIANVQDANYRSNIMLWKDGLASVGVVPGRDWDFQRLPQDHALYHCYYDFDRTPPAHDDYYWKHNGKSWGMVVEPPDYLEGVIIAGRLLGICTAKNYTATWGRWPRHPGFDNTRQLQLGINLVIFALTQEGSITQQVMYRVD